MTPTNVSYGTVKSPVAGGRFVPDATGYNTLVDQIAGWTPGSMHLVSTNRFDSVKPDDDLKNTGGTGNQNGILMDWPGMAHDSRNHRLVVFGGGHASTTANEPYVFDFTRLKWRMAYVPSDYVFLTDGSDISGRSIDFNASPISSHPYHNNVYLPTLDRFVTFGGASIPNAEPFEVWDEANPTAVSGLRRVHCFSLDLRKEGLGFCGGKTGAHSHRGAYASINYHGAEAWSQRDWLSRATLPPLLSTYVGHINTGAVCAQENGHDVLYFTSSNGSYRTLHRAEIVDDDHRNDILDLVCNVTGDAGSGDGSLALDPAKRIVLSVPGAAADLVFADLKRAWGTGNAWQVVTQASITGPVAAMAAGTNQLLGMCFDSRRGVFQVYQTGNQIWELTAPAGDPTPITGWTIAQSTITGTFPAYSGTTHVLGLFRYAPDLGCSVLVNDAGAGNVYLYKPVGWTDPRV